jgi:hypothetical protein
MATDYVAATFHKEPRLSDKESLADSQIHMQMSSNNASTTPGQLVGNEMMTDKEAEGVAESHKVDMTRCAVNQQHTGSLFGSANNDHDDDEDDEIPSICMDSDSD